MFEKKNLLEDHDSWALYLVDGRFNPSDDPVTLRVGYTKNGLYLGEEKNAKFITNTLGVTEQFGTTRDGTVANIGFNPKEQKWYGWSHRAIYGFGIGDIVEEGDCCATSGLTDDYLQSNPEKDLSLSVGFKAESLEDAKRMAIAFADSVG